MNNQTFTKKVRLLILPFFLVLIWSSSGFSQESNVTISDASISSEKVIVAFNKIDNTSTVDLTSTSKVILKSGNEITFKPGFSVAAGAELNAEIVSYPSSKNLDFDGVDDYVFVPDTDVLEPTNSITIDFWIFLKDTLNCDGLPTALGQNNWRYIIKKGVNENSGYNIIFEEDGGLIIRFGNSSYLGFAVYRFPFSDFVGKWNHVAATFNLVNSTNAEYRYYLNGILKHSYDREKTTGYSILYDSEGLKINNNNGSSCPLTGKGNLPAKIRDLRIWNRALSANEVKDNMFETLSTPLPNGLIGYWKFDEGSGQTLHDESGNGNDGLLGASTEANLDYLDPIWETISVSSSVASSGSEELAEKVETENAEIETPKTFGIKNYPNPFNPTTNLSYTILDDGFVSVKVFNILGQEIKTLRNEFMKKGNYSLTWGAEDNNNQKVASGNYLVVLSQGSNIKTISVTLLK